MCSLFLEAFGKMLLGPLAKGAVVASESAGGGPWICLGHAKQVSPGLGPTGKIPTGPQLGLRSRGWQLQGGPHPNSPAEADSSLSLAPPTVWPGAAGWSARAQT